MPPKKRSVPTSLGIKETVECHLCKKKMRFDFLRDEHFPKAHGQKYSRPRERGQPLLSAMFSAKEPADMNSTESQSETIDEERDSEQMSFQDAGLMLDHDTQLDSDHDTQLDSDHELTIQEQVPESVACQPSVSNEQPSEQILREMQLINSKLDAMRLQKETKVTAKSSTSTEEDMQKLRLKASRSVFEICSLNDCLQLTDDKQYLACIPCTYGLKTKCPGQGYFSLKHVQYDELIMDIHFRTLKSHIQRHLDISTHKELANAPEFTTKSSRVENIGKVVTGVAYQIIHGNNFFREFSRQIAMLDVNGVDVGNINHSFDFLDRFLESIYKELIGNVSKFLHTPLSCTNRMPPICLKPDKFTHKLQGAQGLIIRHPCLTNGRLFRETYVSHEKVEGSGCMYWMQLMIDSVKTTFQYNDSEIRQVFKGMAADGAYIKNHSAEHLSEILNIPLTLTDNACIWDYCHKLERADFHTRKVNTWINKADDVRKALMKDVKWGNTRNQLIEICENAGVVHREFVSFSDTRFAEYRHRTYKVFLEMHQALYQLYQQLASADTPEAPNHQERVLHFQNPETCLKLAFMYDLSQLLTRTQKHCQDQKLLPPERKQRIETLISNFRAAHSSFLANEIPETLMVTAPKDSNLNPWVAWKYLKEKFQEIEEKHTFQGVPIVLAGQQGRRSRNIDTHVGTTSLKPLLCPIFAKLIGDYLSQLEKYFLPWPEWLSLTEDIFIWNNDLEESSQNRLQYRLSSLEKLIECPMQPEQMTVDQKQILKDQYTTLFIQVQDLLKENGQIQKNSDIWNKICTTASCYECTKDIIYFALCFLVRDQNECSVESLIGDIQEIDSKNRPRLSHKTATMQEFVRKNGPNPLTSWELRKKALDRIWPKGWHFLVADRVGRFQSAVVTSLVSDAKTDDYCFF